MRGRLIFPILAELWRLDTRATDVTDPDGGGPQLGGYDPDFKESVLVPRRGTNVGDRVRVEHPPVRIPCQVEPESFDALREFASGNAPRTHVELVMHFTDLERLRLVDAATGDALVRPGDRLAGLFDTAGAQVQAIRTPPGLYVTEARPFGFGLGRRHPRRNLLLVVLNDRQLATGRAA